MRNRLEDAVNFLATRSPAYWRLMAWALLTLLSAIAMLQASIVVDGERYFWLDDDQMISMRYARNLAQGAGLVWNPGERVEGYTNFLWTLVMTAVHLLPLGDAHTSVAVRVINWVLAGAVLWLSERLLRLFYPEPGLALPCLLLSVVACLDLLYWSVNGFETTLLTVAFLGAVVRLVTEARTGHPRVVTYLLIGLLPLIRSDAFYLWAAAALVALGPSHCRGRVVLLLAVALVLPVSHLVFRYDYYGDWLPNTYYLKVTGLAQRFSSGLKYAVRFGLMYGVAFVLAVLGSWIARDRRRWLLLGGVVISALYVLIVGRDLFNHCRYFAHLVPIILTLACVSILEVTQQKSHVRAPLLLVLFVATFATAGVYSPSALHSDIRSRNGRPEFAVVTGLLIQRHTQRDAKLAVIAAGAVPYFSHRYAIDLLGKSDTHIARLAPHPGGVVGHNKFDIEYSLGREPDLVVALHRKEWMDWASGLTFDPLKEEGHIYNYALVRSATFQRFYRPNAVALSYLLEHTPVYIRSSSPELKRIGQWREPALRTSYW